MTVTKAASIRHFQDVVRRIRKNSWFADTVLRDNFKFNISFKDGAISITEVPAEPFDSLLLNVRKLTQQKEPQNLLKIYRELKRRVRPGPRTAGCLARVLAACVY